ncbi:DUF927 domain-containing protein [Planococcus sp. 107-1]|uniref:DUF927 domain-containing protein n=1 Tax=Planococcus sp. 107-1 TaxID=2908840 RepID=UPI001F2ECFF2|nr:DUF927 domain-containing protein [Planococcus sp. 107-1]UJF27450.1 DUF927 domain-containing protein [Planococcus sp. 107-1]
MTKTFDAPIITNYLEKVNRLLPSAKVIKLKGYSNKNPKHDYSMAKTPVEAWQDAEPMTETQIDRWIAGGGWIGATLPENRFIIDVDDTDDGALLKDLLEGENVSHHCIKTVRGWQFIFKASEQRTAAIKQVSNHWSAIGIRIDTKPPGKGYVVFPSMNTAGREIASESLNELAEVPDYLHPVWNASKTKDYEFPLPLDEGSRNNTLYEFARRLHSCGVHDDLVKKSTHLIHEYFVPDKKDFNSDEVDTLINSALSLEVEKRPKRETFELHIKGEDSQQIYIPTPYYRNYSEMYNKETLFKTVIKIIKGEETEVPKMVCRHLPVVTRSYTNVEKSQLYYEVQWTDHNRIYSETVPAGSLATKKDLLKLADMSLGVNDLNAKDLIDYFDKFVTQNEIDRQYLVERLGHVKNGFFHPLMADGVKILPSDIGEKQMLEAFEVSGTADGWINEVFEKIKDHPKAILMVLGAFTSVILSDLKLSPFIIDLSGPTSKGKTTVLKVSASVWGNGHLVNEWNTTKVAVERKAAFLNSFPLMLDDTMKADEKQLKAFVYNFSGGRSKGRGSVSGSQEEYSWNNLLLSTGETSLTDYAMQAGGAAARVLPISGLPFEDVEYDFFNELYEAIEENHGAIGIEFLKQWKDKKAVMLPLYKEFNAQFQKHSAGNEVLGRIARHYAAVVFTANLLNDFFQLEINLNELTYLFDEIAKENKAIDKPMQLLEAILSDLDADRGSIHGKTSTQRDTKAVFKNKTLYLLPNYLKGFLKSEQTSIRNEWLRREITIGRSENGKFVDYQQIKQGGNKYRGIAVQPEIVEKLGFDFEEDIQQYQGYQID